MTVPKRRRRKRGDLIAPVLPPLPAGTAPEDGQTRFDWRERALSRKSHADGNLWFPGAYKRRETPLMTKLNETQMYWPELTRYKEHFVPLLEAEQAEVEAQFNERLLWDDDRLMKAGYMIDRMAADVTAQPKYAVNGTVVTFTKTGSEATRELPYNNFSYGQVVLLSRTHPNKDPALDSVSEALKGRVNSQSKGAVKVVFPSLPKDLTSGHWRLDIGCSDLALRKQLEAMDRLNLDPVQQDLIAFSQSSIAKSSSLLLPEDQAHRDELKRRNRKEEILLGTGLRDLLLRRFQTDYVPCPSHVEGNQRPIIDAVGSDALTMKPTDIDATVSPMPHLDDTIPRGIVSHNKLIESWTRRYRTREGEHPVVIEGDPIVPLNSSQTRAIAMMLSERFSLVQGPPGTGKTRVIVETIKLLKKHWQIPHPILVCAHTNVAVDNLLEGLNEHGLKALRYGKAERVKENLQDLVFEQALEDHPLHYELTRLTEERKRYTNILMGATPVRKGNHIRNELSSPLERNPGISEEEKTDVKAKINVLSGRIYGVSQKIRFEVLANADVICTTCLSATSRMLEAIDFPFVFLDEASMATEPLSLVPMTRGSAQVAIIGDHKQLPPIIISETAQAGGLATSMFERLIHERQIPSIMLDTQYRMHPDIAAFSNKTFYNSTLKDGKVLPDGSIQSGLEPPTTDFLLHDDSGRRLNVTFLDHDFPESPQNRSIANYHEAGRVCDIVGDLLHRNSDLCGEDIGVIAPYVQQIRVIDEYLKKDEARQQALVSWLGEARAQEVQDVEIKTVDGFEGREKQVILFSTVRSNAQGYIGFLADWRRLNVGLTRAKRGLVIIGSGRTLSQARTGAFAQDSLPQGGAKVWRDFMTHLKVKGMIMKDRS